MKVDLMSLVNERSKSVTSGQKKIKKLFSDVCDISCEFAEYANEKKFITALAECIPEDDIIVLAAESMLFPAFKKFVAKALNLEMKNSKAVAKAILAANPDISEDEILKQSLIPAGTKPLLTNDGMYSGFAIKSKQRHIFVLPLDEERTGDCLEKSVRPYLAANVHTALPAMPPKDAPIPKDLPYDGEFIQSTANEICAMGKIIALANTKTVDFIGNVADVIPQTAEMLFLSDYFEEKADTPVKEYSVKLARGAMVSMNSDLGASVTKVYSVKHEDGSEVEAYIYVCIADAEKAEAVKLFADNGESPAQLIYNAIEQLFKLILDYFEEKEPERAEEIKKANGMKKTGYIAANANSENYKAAVWITAAVGIIASIVIQLL